MKKNILLLIIFSSFLLSMCAQSNDVTIIKEISKSIPKDLYILDYAIGNFISEKDLSIIVFCDKIANKDAAKSVQKSFLYEINKNKPKLWGELKINCCYYNYEKDLNSFYKSLGMEQNLSSLGTSYKFGWIGDFNDNGITELMLVQSVFSEEGATIEFIEFNNGNFKITLPAKDDICYILNVNKETHSMKLERSKYSLDLDDYKVKTSEIIWDPDSFSYLEK